MIFVTGDTHGEFTRFGTAAFPWQREMTKEDFVIVCGDFGIWDGSRQERYWLRWLEEKSFTTLFVTGNHSNYDRLGEYPVSTWRGGRVQFIQESVIHLMRGQVFDLEGLRFFTMGGASSHDISAGILEPDDPDFKRKKRRLDAKRALYRINHVSWWQEELPSPEEYRTARDNLERCGWQVDYLITHCCPTSLLGEIGGDYQPDMLTDFFQELRMRCRFTGWYFGHYHQEREFAGGLHLLYREIRQITQGPGR